MKIDNSNHKKTILDFIGEHPVVSFFISGQILSSITLVILGIASSISHTPCWQLNIHVPQA